MYIRTVVTLSCMLASHFDREQECFSCSMIRQYFKPRDSLPDPRWPMCNSVVSNAIAMANKEVEKEIAKKKKKKRDQ